jgi:hypothetical protein
MSGWLVLGIFLFILSARIIVKFISNIKQRQYDLQYIALQQEEKTKIFLPKIREISPNIILDPSINMLESRQTITPEVLQFKKLVETQALQIHQQAQLLTQRTIQLAQTTEELNTVKIAHVELHAKYLKKVTTREEKKQNLAKYRATKSNTRKELSTIVAEIIEEKDKWLPHARETPASNIRGKKKGGHGGGKHCPVFIHDHQETHVKSCPICKKDLSSSREKTAYTHIITDIETIQADVQDYKHLELRNIQIHHYGRWCPFCHKWVYHEFGALKYVRYGLNFIIYVISKRIRSRATFDIIIAELWEQFGDKLTLTAPAIIQWFLRYEEVLTEVYNQFKTLLGKMGYVHIDETGLPMRGENWWVWVICNAHFSLFFESKTRGYQAIEALMKDFSGAVVSDCWTAYEKLELEQQKCLGHIEADLNETLVAKQKENARIEKALCLPAARSEKPSEPDSSSLISSSPSSSIQTPPLKKPGRPKKEVTISDTDRVKLFEIARKNAADMIQVERLRNFIGDAWKEGSPLGYTTPRSDRWLKSEAEQHLMSLIESIRAAQPTDQRLERVLGRCEKYKDELFTYLDYDNMPPDNNCAERDLRHFAVQRRVSTNFQNDRVIHSYLLYKSLFKTCQKNDKDFALLLKKLLQRQPVDFLDYFFNGTIPANH